MLVVDDGSRDDTAALAEAAGAIVVRYAQNQGKDAARRTGFKAAAKLNPDAVVTIDADGQHLPVETSRVIAPVLAGQADLVVGSRYLQHASRVPYHRVCGHYFFKLVINRLSGVTITDTQSGFRAFSIRALRVVNAFQANGFGVESEMQFQAHKFQLRVTEVPITVRYYQEVKRSVIKQGLAVLSQILRLTLHYRPGMVYSATSLVALFLKLLNWRTLFTLLPALLLAEVVTWGFVLLHDRKHWPNKLRAYAWIVTHWSQVMQQRRQTLALKQVSDHELIARCTYRLAYEQTSGGLSAQLAHLVFDPLYLAMRRLALNLI